MEAKESIMDRQLTAAFRLGGIVYVPHYLDATLFVGPGYGKQNRKLYSAGELRDMGAVAVSEFLWPRPKYSMPIDVKAA